MSPQKGASSSGSNIPGAAPRSVYTRSLSVEEVARLRVLLEGRNWGFEERPYMRFFARHEGLTVAVYEKGPKIVVQGRGLEEFVQFVLEPEVLGSAESGYEEVHNPQWFEPHFGIDESGKGDFFGPLVIAGVYVDREMARQWRAAGVQDSKNIGSDARVRDLARLIQGTPGAATSVVLIGPERYNALYEKFGNLNRLLAWGHARVIENLLQIRPDCPRALSDQFANPRLIQNALLEKGRGIQLEQRTKAESDPAVAAASILARCQFVDWLSRTGRELGVQLPKGASAAVKTAAVNLVRSSGSDSLGRVAKLHFKTAAEVLSEAGFTPLLPENGKCD